MYKILPLGNLEILKEMELLVKRNLMERLKKN
jgi:hypothetical protein